MKLLAILLESVHKEKPTLTQRVFRQGCGFCVLCLRVLYTVSAYFLVEDSYKFSVSWLKSRYVCVLMLMGHVWKWYNFVMLVSTVSSELRRGDTGVLPFLAL